MQSCPNVYKLVFTVFRFFTVVPLLLLVVFTPARALASVNQTINFQGKLVDSSGLNVPDGTQYQLTFSLYNISSGGSALWTEVQSNVSVTSGIFQVQLGSVTPLTQVDFNNANLYLGITVSKNGTGGTTGETEMTPRIQFTAVPYAFNAASLQGVVATQSATGFTLTGGYQNPKTLNLTDNITVGLTITPTSSNALTVKSNGSNGLTLDTGGAAAIGIGASANAITIGNNTFANNTAVTITTGGSGVVTIGSNTGTGNVLVQPNAGGQAALVVDDKGTGDIFTASASGATEFTVARNGNITTLGTVTLPNSNTLTGVSNFVQFNNGVAVAGGTTYFINGTTSSLNSLQIAGNVYLPITGGTEGFWQLASNVIAPSNAINDLVLGGNSTASAKFHVFGATGNTLIGSSATFALGTLDVRSTSITTPVASVSGDTGKATLIVDQKGIGDIFTASQSGGTRFTIGQNGNITDSNYAVAGGIVYGTSTGLLQITGAGSSSQCLIGGATPVWGSCATGTVVSPFKEVTGTNGGVIVPLNATEDFLVGGTSTSSADFAFINVNSGTPTASISAGIAGSGRGIYLAGNGTIGTTANQNLVLAANTGISNVQITPNAGGQAALMVNDYGSGDLFTASKSGTTKFTINNTGGLDLAAGAQIQPITDSTTAIQFTNAAGTTPLLNFDTTNSLIKLGPGTSGYAGGTCKGSGAAEACANVHIVGNSGSNFPVIIENTSAVGVLSLSHDYGGTIYAYNFNIGSNIPADFDLVDGNGNTQYYISSANAFFALGKNNTSPLAPLDVKPSIYTSPVASMSGATGIATLVLDQTGVGAILTASQAGGTRFVLSSNGNITDSNYAVAGGILYGTSTGLMQITGAGTGSQCLVGGATPSWGSCGSSTGGAFKELTGANGGVIVPLNATEDFLVGGTATTSSSFAFMNVAGGTPTASISAGIANSGRGLYITGAGTIATTANQNLVLGANTGISTVVVSPNAGGQAALIINDQGVGDILTASSGATTEFVISNSGNISVASGTNIDTFTSSGTINLAGGANTSTLNLGKSGGTINLPNFTTNNNSVLYTGASGVLSAVTTTSSGKCLVSVAGPGAPTWGSCSGVSLWNLTSDNGALTPWYTGNDLLLGGTSTSSADFAFINVLKNTPTASISAGLNNGQGLYITGAGTIATTANQNLVLGANTGISTVVVSPNAGGQAALLVNSLGKGDLFTASAAGTTRFVIQNGGNVGIGTTNPSDALQVVGTVRNTTTSGSLPTAAKGSVNSSSTTGQVIQVAGKYGYVLHAGSATGAFEAFDLTNPASPVSISRANLSTSSVGSDFVVAGQYAYVTEYTGKKFEVVDISNPSSMKSVYVSPLVDSPTAAFVQGKYLYMTTFNGTTAANNRLYIFDISNPVNPIQVSSTIVDSVTASGLFTLFVKDRYAYMIGGTNGDIYIFDISNPAAPSLTTGTTLSACGSGINGDQGVVTEGKSLVVEGGFAYLACDAGSSTGHIMVLNVKNPTSIPAALAIVATNTTSPTSITISGRYLYAAENSSAQAGTKVEVFDTSIPASTTSVGTITTSAGVDDVAVNGKYLYTITNNGTNTNLQVFELPGEETTSLFAHSAELGSFQVDTNGYIANNLTIGGGLNVGQDGIVTNGGLGALQLTLAGLSSTIPIASISGKTSFASMVIDQSGAGDLFTASQSGGTRFTIGQNGNITDSNYAVAGGIVYGTSTGLLQITGAGNSSQCLVGGTTPSWGSCGGGSSSPFKEVLGASGGVIVPLNATEDFLIGGTATTSADFAFMNVTNSLISPTASISAGGIGGANNALYVMGSGSISTTNRENLTIGGVSTGQVTIQGGGFISGSGDGLGVSILGGNAGATSGNGGALTIQGGSGAGGGAGGNVTIDSGSGGSPSISIGTTRATAINLGASGTTITFGTGGNTVSFTTGAGLVYAGTARLNKTIVLSAEYAGAVLTASGSATTNGSMTSDASSSATINGANIWKTFYSWTSTTASPLQDYTVAVRVTLPQDFSDWQTNAITIDYDTMSTSNANNALDVYIYNPNATNKNVPVYFSTGNVVSGWDSWGTLTITKVGSGLEDSIDPDWATAGQSAVIYLKMHAMNSNHVLISDIKLNYLSKF